VLCLDKIYTIGSLSCICSRCEEANLKKSRGIPRSSWGL